MIEYKTLIVPSIVMKRQNGRSIREYDDLLDIANAAVDPVCEIIESEGKQGWHLHSCFEAPLKIKPKLSLWTRIKNWWFDGAFFKRFGENRYYMLVFQREVNG